MAKGKKKGNKKEGDEKKEGGDVPSVSGLSIAEDTPSTSQAQEEEEGDGLGQVLSAAARRKLKKQKQLEAKAVAVVPSQETTPEIKPEEKLEAKPESEKPKLEESKEEDSDGLCIVGSKRKPRKKRSLAAAEAAAPKSGSSPGLLQPISEQPVQSSPGQVPPTGLQPGVPARTPQWGPTAGVPSTGPPGLAQPAPPGLVQSTGKGGGEAGPWQTAQRPATAPQQMPRQSPAAPATSQSQKPSPATSSSHSKEVLPLAPSRQELNCRFRIPIKIIGRTVRVKATKVITNYLPMEFKPIKVYRYDVTVKPDKPKKMLPVVFKLAKQAKYSNDFIAFDQVKNCYCLAPLKNVPLDGTARFAVTVETKDANGKSMSFEVSFKATGVVDFAKIKQHMESGGSTLTVPSEEIQCVDVILRQGALESYVKSGRQFFKRPAQPINLTGGLEMWTGLFQSAIFTSKAYINIDVAHKGFPIQQNLVRALTETFHLKTDRPVDEQWGRDSEYFQSFVKNLRVVATLVGPPNNGQKREFISNMLVAPPGKLKFSCEKDGKNITMTVADYFLREKGYKIKYPNLNCVWVGPRDRYIYYPMELLDVAYGQVTNRQLNEQQLSNMVREAATAPVERKRKIEEVAASMNYSSNTFFKKFGLEISNKFLEVDAKILQPPNLDTGEKMPVTPRKGAWQTSRLVKPEALSSWGFIAMDCNPQACNYESIKDLLLSCGRSMGMQVTEPKMVHFNVKITELQNYLYSAVDNGVVFVFIIVGSRGRPDTYHKVKQIAEKNVGILTQCIKEYTASRRMNPQTIRNILLKVNSKLMGINHVLDSRFIPTCIRSGDVMIVGADVTHPSPDQTSIPSIAAVTASMDPRCVSYNIELSIQTPKKEVIVEFADMMHDHLVLYRKRNNNALPKKIYVFRDGVSEGQFAEVMNSELVAIHKAYQRFNLNTKPEVLFLLVQKRHHTRFFTMPNCANVEPGTVVDTHIVHPKELDFYLVSHQAIKGTARPTRYHAVCNDGNIPHDEVEQLTYYLCHLYVRCTRSVSYPTPTYYAHLACLRARSLTHGQTFDNAALERKPERLRVLEKMLEFSRMFFV